MARDSAAAVDTVTNLCIFLFILFASSLNLFTLCKIDVLFLRFTASHFSLFSIIFAAWTDVFHYILFNTFFLVLNYR